MRYLASVLLSLCCLSVVTAQHLTIDKDFDIAFNGAVKNIVRDDTTLYVIGDFTGAGLLRPYGALLNGNGLTSKSWPRFNGSVDEIISDGNGGWYIAGMFDAIGDSVRYGFAHLDDNFKVTAFNPKWCKGIRTLTLDGAKLYAGGIFTSIGGIDQVGYSVIDITSELLNEYSPRVNGAITYSCPDGMGGFYLSGVFSSAGDSVRNNIAHVSADQKISEWNPELGGGGASFLIPRGDDIIIGGLFLSVNTVPCSNLAIVDRQSGKITKQVFDFNGSVETGLIVGDILYVGGEFTTVNGLARSRFASINLLTGDVEPLTIDFNGGVYSMDVAGGILYVGGQFSNVKALSRSNLAAINPATGNVTSWAPTTNGRVNKLTCKSGTIYVGGQFTIAGGQSRPYMAAMLAAGTLTTWNPSVNDHVTDFEIYNNLLFATGRFTRVGNLSRQYFAAVDLSTGLPDAITCNLNDIGKSLSIVDNSVLITGNFTASKANIRNYFAVIDSQTGAILPEQIDFNSIVTGIEVTNDKIFIGGNFTKFNFTDVTYLVAAQKSTLNLIWSPALNANVFSLSLKDQNLFAGGVFTSIDAQPRSYAASIDINTLQIKGWNPGFNNAVAVIAPQSDDVLIGGYFTKVAGQNRSGFASISSVGSVNPIVADVNGYVSAILVANDTLFLGGEFSTVNGVARSNIASFIKSSATLSSWNPTASSRVTSLGHSPAGAIAGGIFSYIGLTPRKRIAAISIPRKQLNSWSVDISGPVDAIALSDEAVYISGGFGQVNSVSKSFVAALDKKTAQLLPFDAGTNGPVNAMTLVNDKLYLAGNFLTIKNQPRKYLGAVEAATGNVIGFSPMPNGIPQVLTSFGDTLFVAGYFSMISSELRNRLAAYSSSTGLLLPWITPEITHTVTVQINEVKALSDGVIVGGSFSTVGGLTRKNIVKLNRMTGAVMNFNPSANVAVYSVDADEDFVYSGGTFKNIGGLARTHLGVLDPITGKATKWKYYIDQAVNAVSVYGKYMFIGGDFARIEGEYKNAFAAFKFNEKPKLSIENTAVSICESKGSDVPFEVYDDFLSSVNFEISSSNQEVIANEQLSIQGSGAERIVNIQGPSSTGQTTITITVTDNVLQTHQISFSVNVVSINSEAEIVGQTVLSESENQTTLSIIDLQQEVVRWESSPDSINWSVVPNVNPSLQVTLDADSLYYRAIVSNNSCEFPLTPILLRLVEDEEWRVNVYPVPVVRNDLLLIRILGKNEGSSEIEIFDGRGIQVLEKTISAETKAMELNSASFAPGLYMLRVTNASNQAVVKFLVL